MRQERLAASHKQAEEHKSALGATGSTTQMRPGPQDMDNRFFQTGTRSLAGGRSAPQYSFGSLSELAAPRFVPGMEVEAPRPNPNPNPSPNSNPNPYPYPYPYPYPNPIPSHNPEQVELLGRDSPGPGTATAKIASVGGQLEKTTAARKVVRVGVGVRARVLKTTVARKVPALCSRPVRVRLGFGLGSGLRSGLGLARP